MKEGERFFSIILFFIDFFFECATTSLHFYFYYKNSFSFLNFLFFTLKLSEKLRTTFVKKKEDHMVPFEECIKLTLSSRAVRIPDGVDNTHTHTLSTQHVSRQQSRLTIINMRDRLIIKVQLAKDYQILKLVRLSLFITKTAS